MEINSSKEVLVKINTTTQQINTTLTITQQSQECKEKFGLWPEFLGLILGVIFAIMGVINKRNKKLKRRLWISVFIVIILVIITRISIAFFICNF